MNKLILELDRCGISNLSNGLFEFIFTPYYFQFIHFFSIIPFRIYVYNKLEFFTR